MSSNLLGKSLAMVQRKKQKAMKKIKSTAELRNRTKNKMALTMTVQRMVMKTEMTTQTINQKIWQMNSSLRQNK